MLKQSYGRYTNNLSLRNRTETIYGLLRRLHRGYPDETQYRAMAGYLLQTCLALLGLLCLTALSGCTCGVPGTGDPGIPGQVNRPVFHETLIYGFRFPCLKLKGHSTVEERWTSSDGEYQARSSTYGIPCGLQTNQGKTSTCPSSPVQLRVSWKALRRWRKY